MRVAAGGAEPVPAPRCGRGPEGRMQITRAGFLALPPIVQAALLIIGGAACVALQNGLIRIVSAEIRTSSRVLPQPVRLLALLPAMGGRAWPSSAPVGRAAWWR